MYKIPYYTASTRTVRELIKAAHTAPPDYVSQYERAIPRVVVLIVRGARDRLFKRRRPSRRAEYLNVQVADTWQAQFDRDFAALHE